MPRKRNAYSYYRTRSRVPAPDTEEYALIAVEAARQLYSQIRGEGDRKGKQLLEEVARHFGSSSTCVRHPSAKQVREAREGIKSLGYDLTHHQHTRRYPLLVLQPDGRGFFNGWHLHSRRLQRAATRVLRVLWEERILHWKDAVQGLRAMRPRQALEHMCWVRSALRELVNLHRPPQPQADLLHQWISDLGCSTDQVMMLGVPRASIKFVQKTALRKEPHHAAEEENGTRIAYRGG